MPELTAIQHIVIWILPILFAVTLHEAGHAWVAYLLGDNTAKMLGRLSFNPMRHIDLFGTIIIPIVMLLLSNFQFVFGWAKPVPINSYNFKNPRRDTALATAAGPSINLIMAILWAILFKISSFFNPSSSVILFMLLTARAGIFINLLLAFLNLIPIPPLDGSKILASLLPAQQALLYLKLEPFGFLILILLMFSGLLGVILNPLLHGSLWLISLVFHL